MPDGIQSDTAEVYTIDLNLPFSERVDESEQSREDATLASTGSSNNADVFPSLDVESKTLEHKGKAGAIAELDVAKGDGTARRPRCGRIIFCLCCRFLRKVAVVNDALNAAALINTSAENTCDGGLLRIHAANRNLNLVTSSKQA
jgi:hypothetical protein